MLSPCLVALALLPCARAAWVEISQQHYRRPVRLPGRHDLTHTSLEPTGDTFVLNEGRWDRNGQPYNKDTAHHAVQTDIIRDLDHYEHRWHNEDKDLPASGFKNIGGPRYPAINTDSDPLQNVTSYIPEHVSPVRVNPFLRDETSSRNGFITNGDFNTRDTHFEEVAQSERNPYLNQSLTAHKRGQQAYKPNDVKSETKWTNEDIFDDWDDDADHSTTRIRYNPNDTGNKNLDERSKYEEKDISEPDKGETVSGKIERIPNIGSVQRVQLANTPVKSPAVKVADLNRKYEGKIHRQPYTEFSDELDVTTHIFNSHKNSRVPDSNNTFNIIENVSNMNREDIRNSTIDFQRHRFTQKPDFHHLTHIATVNTKRKETKSPELIVSEADNDAQIANPASDQLKEDFKPSKNNIESDKVTKHVETSAHKHGNNIDNENNQNIHRNSVKIEKVTKDSVKSSEKEDISGEIKVNTLEKILKFMKVVADTISKNTRKGTNGKVAYLNELKHALLTNIKGRIDATWPEDSHPAPAAAPTDPATRRHSRAAAPTPRGHVEVPSSESSLMTISFLTFAVFLIKLVLQVIQTYKHKAMLMAPLMVSTAGRTAHRLRTAL